VPNTSCIAPSILVTTMDSQERGQLSMTDTSEITHHGSALHDASYDAPTRQVSNADSNLGQKVAAQLYDTSRCSHTVVIACASQCK
jgi:hypothetical protein